MFFHKPFIILLYKASLAGLCKLAKYDALTKDHQKHQHIQNGLYCILLSPPDLPRLRQQLQDKYWTFKHTGCSSFLLLLKVNPTTSHKPASSSSSSFSQRFFGLLGMRKCWSLEKAHWGSQPTCFGARFKDVMSMPGPGIVTHFFCSLLSTFLPLSIQLNGSLGWVSKLKGLKWSRFNRNNSIAELVTCHVDGFVGDFQGLHNWHKAPGGS